ncbi:unnamed protein product [Rotaria magnacalcarata]|uniref:Uncharacterized protein n=1 Tax=Rotaria magnacalcarata TaxID=392030 RepID=A0A8S2M409_9BILA|nr:unnamed protein product [Rotaria magnacalcarata]
MNTITNIHKPSPYAIATDLIPFIPVANHWYVPHGDKFYPLNEHSLTDLLNNRIAAIKVPHFLSEDECAACIKTIDRQRQFDIVTESVKEGESCIFETVSFSEDHGLVKRVGISQSEYTWEQRESYFDQVHENAKFVHTLECDPLTRTTKALQASWPYGQVSIAYPGGSYGSYWILWILLDPMDPTGSYGSYWILWILLDPMDPTGSYGSYWILMDPDGP